MKVLDQQYSANSLTLRLSALGGSQQSIMLRVNDPRAKPRAEGAQIQQTGNPSLRPVQIDFGAGDGYVEKTVKFTW
jgi:hypothetical protein